jgi:hypothetical protein
MCHRYDAQSLAVLYIRTAVRTAHVKLSQSEAPFGGAWTAVISEWRYHLSATCFST